MAAFRRYLCLLVFLPMWAGAQPVAVSYIKAKADSVLHTLIPNKDIFKHCVMNENSYYSYIDSGDTKWGTLTKVSKTLGQPCITGVYYTLGYRTSKCHLYDTIWGRIYINFDDRWYVTNTPDVNFIPPYMMKNEPCNFISKKDAAQVAIRNNRSVDLHTMAGLVYYDKKQQFAWQLQHIASSEEREQWKTRSTKEMMNDWKQWNTNIDAETGEIIDVPGSAYGEGPALSPIDE